MKAALLVIVKCLLRKAIPLLRGIKEQRRDVYRGATALDASKRRVIIWTGSSSGERRRDRDRDGKSPSAQSLFDRFQRRRTSVYSIHFSAVCMYRLPLRIADIQDSSRAGRERVGSVRPQRRRANVSSSLGNAANSGVSCSLGRFAHQHDRTVARENRTE
ncbi:hypothetical protein DAPPUDRAFT_106329 [Daphnia pulex]|uniref:Uncharacterized protein n=1 Tax=Daphnia pulex TaxID=6669 RepID=E9GTJ9_DAPPU|nr:hypothetical protein DAPPUDRAFT_106329 [Daphnia pulex]|eukprot:EFX77202.1 hypothetical protein DAPPUDRAFT_106329 [Daphnia pulex]